LDEIDEDDGTIFPENFSVIFLVNDSANINMKWLVSSKFLFVKPEDITLKLFEKNSIDVNIFKNALYRINFGQDSTQAIIVK